MFCPNCHQELIQTQVFTTDKQKVIVDECFNCGGHFLPSLITNFISDSTAKNLDSIIPKNDISPQENQTLLCPICSDILIKVQDEAVPIHLTLFACPKNHGHFFPPGQLLSFKKAQKAKLAYHQIWNIPLKSAFAILLPITFLLTIISILPISLNYLKERQESRISANSPLGKPFITPLSSNEVIISFTTKSPTTSQINIEYQNDSRTLDISTSPKNTHIITLQNLTEKTTYKFTLKTPDFESETYTFTTQ
jgi:Zn-finger nucleic acid-binding protein